MKLKRGTCQATLLKMESSIPKLLKPVICVVGPTASGKTDLAQLLALKLNGEVVSADSMQVYRGMDIGTGKLPESERKVKHYGLDLIEPGKPYSAAMFQSYARNAFEEIDKAHKRSVLAGGTGFYVRAAIDGYNFCAGEQTNNPTREKWQQFAYENGQSATWEKLKELDPKSAAVIEVADTKRVIRALELYSNGQSYAKQKQALKTIPQVIPACMIGLRVNPDILRKRIYARVDKMLEAGLVDEVKHLLDAGFRDGLCAPKAIGYKEIVAFLDGDLTLDEALAKIKTATARYAKRQRTWFRADARIHWLCADTKSSEQLCEEALGVLKRESAI